MLNPNLVSKEVEHENSLSNIKSFTKAPNSFADSDGLGSIGFPNIVLWTRRNTRNAIKTTMS